MNSKHRLHVWAKATCRKSNRSSSVILPPKTRAAPKKHFSIFDEIPEELLEKRRSCRQLLGSAVTSSADNSCDVAGARGAASSAHRLLLSSFLPPALKTTSLTPDSSEQQQSITGRDSNEGYPKVRNHGEGPY